MNVFAPHGLNPDLIWLLISVLACDGLMVVPLTISFLIGKVVLFKTSG